MWPSMVLFLFVWCYNVIIWRSIMEIYEINKKLEELKKRIDELMVLL